MPGKTLSERAMPKAKVVMRDRTPDFVVRCKQGRAWMNVGVAWNRTNGPGLSIKLNAIPVGFDGTLKVLEPLEMENEDPGDMTN